MSKPKINPKLLRMMVIFPNILSYLLLFFLVSFVVINMEELKTAGMFNIWLIITIVLAISSVITTYSIVKKIKQGVL